MREKIKHSGRCENSGFKVKVLTNRGGRYYLREWAMRIYRGKRVLCREKSKCKSCVAGVHLTSARWPPWLWRSKQVGQNKRCTWRNSIKSNGIELSSPYSRALYVSLWRWLTTGFSAEQFSKQIYGFAGSSGPLLKIN